MHRRFLPPLSGQPEGYRSCSLRTATCPRNNQQPVNLLETHLDPQTTVCSLSFPAYYDNFFKSYGIYGKIRVLSESHAGIIWGPMQFFHTFPIFFNILQTCDLKPNTARYGHMTKKIGQLSKFEHIRAYDQKKWSYDVIRLLFLRRQWVVWFTEGFRIGNQKTCCTSMLSQSHGGQAVISGP